MTVTPLGPPRRDQPAPGARGVPAEPEPLWREVLGARLRELRRVRRFTLARTAARAGISTQYLSEVERGLKEPSSEVIAAISGALGISLLELTSVVADDLAVNDQQRRTSRGVRYDLLRVNTSRSPGASGWSGPVALAS
ncbi:helix-turn-helix domain-containing protein [Propionibacteriaceae bacterium Y2011]